MGSNLTLWCIIMLGATYVTGLIIPEEVPTILSLIYSNIPPVKKGTDSRIGVGFSLGEHADFQVLLEIGPQKETEPIGPGESKRRRQIILNAAMKGEYGPWARSIAKINIQKMRQRQENKLLNNTSNEIKTGMENNWLIKWRKEIAKFKANRDPNESSAIQKIRMKTPRTK